jgi:dTDP-4-amino-4,6-dideoxygalactose transaminase
MIPFLDLGAQYRSINEEVRQAIDRLLESNQFVLGSEVEAFESEFAAYQGTQHCIGVNTGTSALHLALLAAGIGPGDEVMIPAMTFVATAAAVWYTGARPVLVDVDPLSYCMDASLVEAAITARTKAIVPVHLYGQPADMDRLLAVARRHGLLVIEDACQAHGAEHRGRRVGGIGEMGCFSFYPAKNLGAYGEGGAVTTNRPDFARTIRMLRDWGGERKYHHQLKGFNYRMDGIQGAILRVKLRHLESWTEARRGHASLYDRSLCCAGVQTPAASADVRHVYHLYPILAADRARLQQHLQAAGVHTGIHYPHPVHLVEAYRDLGYHAGDFPVSERIGAEELSLPMFAELLDSQIEEVAAAIREWGCASGGG